MMEGVYRRNLLVPFLKLVGDLLAVQLAVLCAYYLRFFSPLTSIFPVTKGMPPFTMYLAFSVFLAVSYTVLLAASGSYRSRFFTGFYQEIPVILRVCFLGILLAMSGAFLYRGFSYSRMVFVLIYATSNFFLLAERWLFHRLKGRFLARGFSMLKVCLVGSVENISHIYHRLAVGDDSYFEVIGYLAESPAADLPRPPRGGLPLRYLGKPQQLRELLDREAGCDGLVLAFGKEEHPRVWEVISLVEGKNLELFYVPDILDLLTSGVQTLEVGGVPLLRLKSFVLAGWQGFLKRAFDVLVAAVSLLLLSPLLLLIALLIKVTSRGPVLYVQERVGLDGREFRMLKFRSMRTDAEAHSGPVWATADDPRATVIGRVLRRASLDELPQLINVLKGEMSIVGPRPERRHFVEQFQQQIPRYVERHRVRSGMTGWAQVNGLRGQSPISERTRYDVYYIENWSLWFDVKIIIMTFIAILRGENAY